MTEYGLDGIDFDDEYAKYGTNGTGGPNSSSFVHLVTALRTNLPDKIISLYNIGPSASRLSYGASTSPPSSTTPGTRTTAPGRPPASPCPSRSSHRRLSRSAGPRRARPPASLAAPSAKGTAYTSRTTRRHRRSAEVSAFTRELYGSDAVYTP